MHSAVAAHGASALLPAFDLGPFHVEPDGVLSARAPGVLPTFGFRWRGRAFQAELRHRTLWISARIAGVPFSVEAARSRPAVLAALQAVRAALLPEWRMALPPGARVLLEARAELETPPTARGLVTAAAGFAWQVTPFLDLLEEAGAVPA